MNTMHASYATLLTILIIFLINNAIGQTNQTFCNRLYHSIAVANDKLFVDGGELRNVCLQQTPISCNISYDRSTDGHRLTMAKYLSTYRALLVRLIFSSLLATQTLQFGNIYRRISRIPTTTRQRSTMAVFLRRVQACISLEVH